jgi:4-aminobutyrate aminotransferase-like enzyme
MSVLDMIDEDKLQQNALEVGEYLRAKLLQIQWKFPRIIGCIHGHGLYQGIEIIKPVPVDPTSSEAPLPGTKEAYAICDRLLQLGVITHNTGDHSNVLKVKPPLCFSPEDVDFFCNALEVALLGF